MSARAFALSGVFMAAVSAFGNQPASFCPYRLDIETYQVELLQNDPRDRTDIVKSLQCLRSVSLDSKEKGADSSDTRISNLEDLALADLKRLTDRVVILDNLSANGSSYDSETEYARVRESIRILKAVVNIVDGKPALVPTLFTKKRSHDKEEAAETSFETKCLSDEETPELADIAAVKRCVDIIEDKIKTNALIAAKFDEKAQERRSCEIKATNFQKRLADVEDAGVDIAAEAKNDLVALHKKSEKETDEAERKKLADAITKVEADIKIITDIAIEPAAKRHCLTEDNVVLDDAESVQRCIFALGDAIADAKFAAETPEVRAANDRIADLKAQLARISDAARMLEEAARILGQLKQQKGTAAPAQSRAIDNQIEYASSKLADLEQVPLSGAARFVCGSPGSTSLPVNDKSIIEHCVDGLRTAIATAADEAARLSSVSSKAHQTLVTLEHRRVRALKRGVDIAEDRAKQSAAIAAKLAAAKDPKERDALQTQIAAADAEVVLLTEIAIEPDAEAACIEDTFSHLDIQTARFVTRCIGALSRKVREVRVGRAAECVDCPKEPRRKSRAQLALYEVQLARFEEAGRRMAHLRQEELASNALKRASASDAEKEKLDAKSKITQAELDSLRTVVIVPNEDPQTEYADFEQWFVLMTAGYEYVGATDAFARGFARIGMTVGFHYPGNYVPEEFGSWHPFAYGSYSTFTIALTNSGEAKTTPLPTAFQAPATALAVNGPAALDDTPPASSDVTPAGPVKRALEFEFQSFHPFWRNDYQVENPRLRNRIGSMVVIGGRKVDDESFLQHRIYAGVRVARSPDTFADFLLGRTGGLLSHRVEARGQYALPHTFGGGARLSIGAVGNFGLNKRRHEQCEENSPHCHLAEKDIIKFYVLYDIDAPGLLSMFGLDKKPPAN
ncbi:MAG TPA: hypothetical protein VHX14_08185 [Thermoanaerobaculia bacterium]|nr:hypothetical protein [Thermoanaerobaculia bacterium]